jgi:beta-lactamase regulating signal transducer with metallopeptidase domain
MTLRTLLLVGGDYVLTLIWLKGTLLVLALLLLRPLVARRSAATRSAFWTLAAAGLLALPLLQHLLPITQVALLGFPAFLFEDGGLSGVGRVGLHTEAAAVSPIGWVTAQPLAIWMALVWLAGVVLLLGRFARQLRRARHLARRASPLRDAGLLAGRPAMGPGPGASTQVKYSPSIATPVTFGWRRPVILLPAGARDWSAERLASALSHEFAHVRRRDYLVLLLTEVLRALYWPNPLIWKVAATVRAELEHACDDAVLRAGISRIAYARHLLELATCQRVAPTAGALPMVRRSFFRERLRAILDDATDRAPASRHVLIAAGLLWLLVVGGLGGTGFWRCNQTGAPVSLAANLPGPDRAPVVA